MSLPDESSARAEVVSKFQDLFERAERAHTAAVEIVTRGKLRISKPQGFSPGVVMTVVSMYTKALKTFRAITLVCESGLGQDAAVLARQLFETTVAIAFILQKDFRLRSGMFAAHEDQRNLVLLEGLLKLDPSSELGTTDNVVRAQRKVKDWESVIGEQAVKSVRHHWSGKNLEWAAKQVDLHHAYAVMYRYTSAFAHGSDVNAHFFVRDGSDTPTLKLTPGDDQIQPVLSSSINLLHIIASRLNETLGLGEEEVIQKIAAEEFQPRKGSA